MEYLEYLLDCLREEVTQFRETVSPDLGNWNLDLYYEAVGLDYESTTNENDDQ